MQDILCSVLVACYNHEKYIDDLLKSIYHQTYQKIELIICDDCSTDESWSKIQTFVKNNGERFDDIKLIKHEQNQGLVAGLLEMLEVSKGEIVKDISGDDVLGPTYFDDVVEAYKQGNSDTVFQTNGYFIGEEDHYENLLDNNYELLYNVPPNFEQNNLFYRLFHQNLIYAAGLAAPKRVHSKYGSFDINTIVEDWDLWLKWASTGKVSFRFIDKPDVYYRKNSGSMTSTARNESLEKRWMALFSACEKIIDKYGVNFDRKVYARRKWDYFVYEGNLMRALDFGSEKELLEGRMHEFIRKNGKDLPFIYIVRYYRMKRRGTMVLP